MSSVTSGQIIVAPLVGAYSTNTSVNAIQKLMKQQDKKDDAKIKADAAKVKVAAKKTKEDSKTAGKKINDVGKSLGKGQPIKAIGDLTSGLGKTVGLSKAPKNTTKISDNSSTNAVEKVIKNQDRKDDAKIKAVAAKDKVAAKKTKEDSKTAGKKMNDVGKSLGKGQPIKAIGDLTSGLGKTVGLSKAPDNKEN